MAKKVLVYPKSLNPYQDLLYGCISSESFVITYLQNPTSSHAVGLILLPFQFVYYRLCGYSIFHFHFFYPFQLFTKYRIFYSVFFRTLYSLYFYLIIGITRLLRYKIVWTAHDLIPRSNQFINKVSISRYIARMSHVVIVHSKSTIQEMKRYRIKANRIEIIPIGNYSNIYTNTTTKNKARELLNLPAKCYVFGHFGRIEYYKGVVELIEAFESNQLPNSYLLIAGECRDNSLRSYIETKSKSNVQIRSFLKYISDEEIQYYLNSSDIMVYPFREITTSSSLILSMSFKKCVICPRIGDAIDIPMDLGFFYILDQDRQTSLKMNMISSYKDPAATMKLGFHAYEYISNYSWRRIGADTAKLYLSLD